ncbi:MAG: hypothetical protein ACK559_20905, partial [bacterium]
MDQDHRHVVPPAVVVRHLHQLVGRELQVRLQGVQRAVDLGIGDHVGESVRAHQVDVARNHRIRVDLGLDDR